MPRPFSCESRYTIEVILTQGASATRPIDELSAQEAFSRLLDRAFPVPPGGHFLSDFPIWDDRFSPGQQVRRLGIFDANADSEGRLLGCAGLRIARLKTANGPLPVALIGAVATDPSARGQGLASRLISEAIEQARREGAAMILLWGSEHSLYARFGFELCGTQVRVALAELSAPRVGAAVRTGWNPSILSSLMTQRPGGLCLDPAQDAAWISAHRNVRWFWAGDEREPLAYAALGRGIDLAHMVHEWGGDREALTEIFSAILTEDSEAQLLAPPALLRFYGWEGASAVSERLALVKILDPTRVFAAYHPNIALEAEAQATSWRIRFPQLNAQAADELSAAELTRLLFGPGDVELMKGASALTPLLPLPLWVWGLDAA